MIEWHPQLYRRQGERQGIGNDLLANSIKTALQIRAVNPRLPVVLTLNHLAELTGVGHDYLRQIVSRNALDPYTTFRLKKKGRQGFRVIAVPEPHLMVVQRWINNNILTLGQPNADHCFAFLKGVSIKDAAALHCKCRWLIKLDVRQFFESISEIPAYKVFRHFGYQPLVSFEMARLCTRLGSPTRARETAWWTSDASRYTAIKQYQHKRMGHLPQGAPTSPMLSNLAMANFDQNIAEVADRYKLIYTRYADDLAFSTDSRNFSREEAALVIQDAYKVMRKHGLLPNTSKTKIAPPGSRKVLLGLLVDGEEPKLTRKFKNNLRQHIYYLTKPGVGPAKHAANRKFTYVGGMKNHVDGLVTYASYIEPEFGEKCRQKLSKVQWPFS